jgi:hypothetical protein
MATAKSQKRLPAVAILSKHELLELPEEIDRDQISGFDDIDERMATADLICPFTIGVEETKVVWCPDCDPPTVEEQLVWAYVICPQLKEEIVARFPGKYTQYFRMSTSNSGLIDGAEVAP